MTWLLQAANDVSISSLSELAQKMMESEDWPGDLGFSSRHLANKLGHANAGKDPGWWRKAGSSALPVLATVLGWTESELRQAMDEAFTPSASSRKLWNFDLFPGLRPLDLVEEGPFPAIPYQLCYPDGPYGQRTWWVAPSGAGRTLLGRWLAEGRGWTFIEADTWEEVRSRLPQQGRCYIELHTADDMERQDMEAVPTDLKICVAAPFDPREVWADDDPDSGDVLSRALLGNRRRARRRWMPTENSGLSWDFRETGDSESWYPSMLDWIDRRLDPNGRLDMLALRGHEVAVSVIEGLTSPGEVLGFLGLLDQFGIDAILGEENELDTGRLLRFWTRASLARADDRLRPVRSLLLEHGSKIVQHLVVERIRRGWAQDLEREQWESLVPENQAPRIDLGELRRLLDEGTEGALAMARQMAQPGPAEVVAGLEACRILVRRDHGILRVQPSWLETVLKGEAIELLLAAGIDGLGSLLLNPEVSMKALDLLAERWDDEGYQTAWAMLAEPDFSIPQHAAAITGVFMAMGAKLLLGVNPPPPDLLERIWQLQQGLLMEHWKSYPPLPVLLPALGSDHPEHRTRNSWHVEALCISLELHRHGTALPASALNPWPGLDEGQAEHDGLLRILSGNWETQTLAKLNMARARMGAALLDHLGVLRPQNSVLFMQHPDIIVLTASGRELRLQDEEFNHMLQLPFGLDTLEDACRRRDTDLDQVLRWCWSRWLRQAGHGPPWLWMQTRVPEGVGPTDAERLWRALTPDLLADDVVSANHRQFHLPESVWPWISKDVWRQLIEVWSRLPTFWSEWDGIWAHVPEDVIRWAILTAKLGPQAYSALSRIWERFPAVMLDLIDELDSSERAWAPRNENDPGQIFTIIWALPSAGPSLELTRRVERWLAEALTRGLDAGLLQRWLVARVRGQEPHWREAYRILIESGALTK